MNNLYVCIYSRLVCLCIVCLCVCAFAGCFRVRVYRVVRLSSASCVHGILYIIECVFESDLQQQLLVNKMRILNEIYNFLIKLVRFIWYLHLFQLFNKFLYCIIIYSVLLKCNTSEIEKLDTRLRDKENLIHSGENATIENLFQIILCYSYLLLRNFILKYILYC